MSKDNRKVVLVGTGMVGMSYAYALLNQTPVMSWCSSTSIGNGPRARRWISITAWPFPLPI